MKKVSVSAHYFSILVIYFLCFYPTQIFPFQQKEKEVLASFPVTLDVDLYSSEEVLVRYTEKNNLMREDEGGASLQIYINGYAVVYYPVYMRHAGKYEFHLDQSDMARLWAHLSRKNIVEFDKEAVYQLLYDAEQFTGDLSAEISNVTDAATTLIEIYPNRYKLIGFGDGSASAMKKISWHGLRWDARKYLNIPEIQDLIALQQELEAIMQRSDIKKVK